MKLYEENLKKIVSYIERFGAIIDINIKNNSIKISTPTTGVNSTKSQLTEIDMNNAKEFTIKFEMGDLKTKDYG